MKINLILFSEAIKLVGEGEYNLDSLKEIKITESYLGLEESVRKCQDKEPLNNCTTRHYIDNLKTKCGCLPFHIRLTDEVLFS